jgi:hypothetical protein
MHTPKKRRTTFAARHPLLYFVFSSPFSRIALAHFKITSSFSSLRRKGLPLPAFNGNMIRALIVYQTFRFLDSTSFIETGTFFGHTSLFAAEVFGKPVYSCELSLYRYLVSRILTCGAKRLTIVRQNSPAFVRQLLASGATGDNPFFYLDAHGYAYLPLKDELRIIAELCRRWCVVVDDFFVPRRSGFACDQYDGVRLDSSLVRSVIPRDVMVYYPDYDPWVDTGDKRGYCMITRGQPILPNRFPFTMIRVTDLRE